jgi:hypothetical protein
MDSILTPRFREATQNGPICLNLGDHGRRKITQRVSGMVITHRSQKIYRKCSTRQVVMQVDC